jgi:hypothetical protein
VRRENENNSEEVVSGGGWDERMAQVLAAKGYHYQFVFCPQRRAHRPQRETINVG